MTLVCFCEPLGSSMRVILFLVLVVNLFLLFIRPAFSKTGSNMLSSTYGQNCNSSFLSKSKVKLVFSKVTGWLQRGRFFDEKIPLYVEKKDQFVSMMAGFPLAIQMFAIYPLRDFGGIYNSITLHGSNFTFGLTTMAVIEGGLIYIFNFKTTSLLNRFLATSFFTLINYHHELVSTAANVGADYQDFYSGLAAVGVFWLADFVNELKIQHQLNK